MAILQGLIRKLKGSAGGVTDYNMFVNRTSDPLSSTQLLKVRSFI